LNERIAAGTITSVIKSNDKSKPVTSVNVTGKKPVKEVGLKREESKIDEA
jgi:hypothetical protein